MSSRSQNLCPPEFNFLRGVICFYQLVTILWPPIMRAVTERVLDSDHLVTTGIVAHIYHLPGKKKGKIQDLKVPRLHTAVLAIRQQ